METETYLYLLVHANGKKFKIGIANDVQQWSNQLSQPFDFERSCSLKFSSRQRAREVESSLHKLFQGYCSPEERKVDGYSEWFEIGAHQEVQDFILSGKNLLGYTSIESVKRKTQSVSVNKKTPHQSMKRVSSDHLGILWDETNKETYDSVKQFLECPIGPFVVSDRPVDFVESKFFQPSPSNRYVLYTLENCDNQTFRSLIRHTFSAWTILTETCSYRFGSCTGSKDTSGFGYLELLFPYDTLQELRKYKGTAPYVVEFADFVVDFLDRSETKTQH